MRVSPGYAREHKAPAHQPTLRIAPSNISHQPQMSPDRMRFAVLIRHFSPICPPQGTVAFIDVASRGHGGERAKFSRHALHGAGADAALSGHFKNALAGP